MKSFTSILVLAIAIANVAAIPVDNARPAASTNNGNTHDQNTQNGNTGVIDSGNNNPDHSGNTGHFGGRARAVEAADVRRPVNIDNGNTSNINTQNGNTGVIAGGNDNTDHSGNTGHFGGRARAIEATDARRPPAVNIGNGNTINQNTQNHNSGVIDGGNGNTGPGGNTGHFGGRAVDAADARRSVNIDNGNTNNRNTQNGNTGVIEKCPVNSNNGNTSNKNTQNGDSGVNNGGNNNANHSGNTGRFGSSHCGIADLD